MLAHADRTRVIADAHRAQLVTKNLRVRATFLWDGEVAGTWTVEREKGTAILRIAPFARLPGGAAAALRDEAEPLVRFIDAEAGAHEVSLERPGPSR